MVSEFIQQYFIAPLYKESLGYNVYNTAVYAIVLVLAIFLVYKLLKKLDLKIDFNFILATLPFIALASTMRVLRDADIVKSPVYVSPILYFLVFGITFGSLLVAIGVERKFKISYVYTYLGLGLGFLVYHASKLSVSSWMPALQITGLALLSIVVVFALRYYKPELLTKINTFILSASMIDAASTVIGVLIYGYYEKHVLPVFLINIFGPWIMLPLKFFVILFALYAIDQSESDVQFKNFMKFAILAVTLGPGLRNTIRLVMGV